MAKQSKTMEASDATPTRRIFTLLGELDSPNIVGNSNNGRWFSAQNQSGHSMVMNIRTGKNADLIHEGNDYRSCLVREVEMEELIDMMSVRRTSPVDGKQVTVRSPRMEDILKLMDLEYVRLTLGVWVFETKQYGEPRSRFLLCESFKPDLEEWAWIQGCWTLIYPIV